MITDLKLESNHVTVTQWNNSIRFFLGRSNIAPLETYGPSEGDFKSCGKKHFFQITITL